MGTCENARRDRVEVDQGQIHCVSTFRANMHTNPLFFYVHIKAIQSKCCNRLANNLSTILLLPNDFSNYPKVAVDPSEQHRINNSRAWIPLLREFNFLDWQVY
jgi:hypothetical protein